MHANCILCNSVSPQHKHLCTQNAQNAVRSSTDSPAEGLLGNDLDEDYNFVRKPACDSGSVPAVTLAAPHCLTPSLPSEKEVAGHAP